MKFPRQITKTADFILEHFSKDLGTTLIWTTIVGWIASSAAQICGILRNPNYTKEQKSFMIPQEIGDAAMNIATFFLITTPLKKFANKLVKTGKIIPKALRSQIVRHGDADKIGSFDFNIRKLPYFQSANMEKTYNSFHNFMSTSAAVVGGIISSNIVTPILRNRLASKHKDKAMLNLISSNNMNRVNINNPSSTQVKPVHTSVFDHFKQQNMSI